MSQRALVLCPGRGAYTAADRNWLQRPLPPSRRPDLERALDRIDSRRRDRGHPAVREMDAGPFRQECLRGENVAALIFACTAHDLLALDTGRVRVVAVGGNSMGWYSALWAAGALGLDDSIELVETMGGMFRDGAVGGQVVYPVVDQRWREDEDRVRRVTDLVEAARRAGHRAGLSIRFGGFRVLWADDGGLQWLLDRMPPVTLDHRHYPLRLPGNSAFHSPLMQETSSRALESLSSVGWRPPELPLIDGRGKQWRPGTADADALRRYTLETQVLTAFDFAATVRVGLREYAPDWIVLLGPGDTLTVAVAHVVIAEGWHAITDRRAFLQRQQEDPLLISLARPEQARRVLGPGS